MSQEGINELQQVINELAKAEKKSDWDDKIRIYRNSFSELEGLKEIYPEFKIKIKNIKKRNLRQLLCDLELKVSYLDFEIWHSIYKLFFEENSKETGEACLEKPELKKYINSFYLMYFDAMKGMSVDLNTSILLGIATEDDLETLIQAFQKK